MIHEAMKRGCVHEAGVPTASCAGFGKLQGQPSLAYSAFPYNHLPGKQLLSVTKPFELLQLDGSPYEIQQAIEWLQELAWF